MAVVLSVAMLGSSCGTDKAREEAAQQLAKTHAQQIVDTAKLYRLKNGSWPTIEDLAKKDGGGQSMLSELPQDPWGGAYVLVPFGDGNKGIRIVSPGPDRVAGNADDFVFEKP